MKKVLLSTTAVVFTAGWASAGDMSMSGSVSLTYGSFGTGSLAATGTDDFSSEAALNVAASSTGGSIGMSGTLELDTDAVSVGALALSLTTIDETNGPTDVTNGLQYGSGDNKTTIGATYTTGPYTIAISGDDQDDQDWDASVAMAAGDTTVTVAADEAEVMSVGIAYTSGAMSISASQEFSEGDDTVVSLSYTEGALTFGAAMDTGQEDHFGDEAQLVLTAGYTDGDVSIAAKGTDQDEMEVSVSFAF